MLTQRLINTALSLINGKPTSRDMMQSIPANNPPDYLKMLRHDYGITVLKEKVKGKRHFVFWAPQCEHSKVRKLIAAASTTAIDKLSSISKTTNSECSLPQSDSKEGLL